MQASRVSLGRRRKPNSAFDSVVVQPREDVRLLELYESQLLNKTYLNIEPKNGRKKKA